MVQKLASVDVVLVGFGWTAAILGQELSDAGLKVLAIERGGWRDTSTDFAVTFAQDELRYYFRHDLFQEPARETLTFRNSASQTALPMRKLGSFLPGTGVGGAGIHWNGMTWRFLPSDFIARSHNSERYGAAAVPDTMTIQDWGVTYDELEPHYDKFEYLCGIAGRAGNIKGAIQDGGNPFEGARAREYPNPPLDMVLGPTLFAAAAKELGYHPFPGPRRQHVAALHQPARRHAWTLHLLRLLRKVRLRQLFEVESANHDHSCPAAQGQFRAAHRERGSQDQSRFDRQARNWRDLCRSGGPRVRTARRDGHSHRLHPSQRAPDAGFGHRQALRPRDGRRDGWQELRLPDHIQRQRLLRRQGDEPVHWRWLARHGGRQFQRRQLRPFRHGLHWRRLYRLLEHRRPADRNPSGAGGHAKMGREVEAGGREELPHDHLDRDPRSGDEPPRQLPRSRSDLQEHLRPAAVADDFRFHRQRTQDVAIPDRQGRRDCESDEATRGEGQRSQWALFDRAVPDHSQYRWHHHGHGSEIERPQPLSAKLGRAEPVRHGCRGLPAKSRLQPDRHRWRAGLLGGGCDQAAVPQEPGPVGAGMMSVIKATIAMGVLAVSGLAAAGGAQPFSTLQKGKYLVDAGDCVACHTATKSQPFAGGRAIPTPFGTIYSANITPDRDTGIGAWSENDFYRAMHEGRGPHGERLYPAFPYPYFTKMTREDVSAIRAYLMTLKRSEERRVGKECRSRW